MQAAGPRTPWVRRRVRGGGTCAEASAAAWREVSRCMARIHPLRRSSRMRLAVLA